MPVSYTNRKKQTYYLHQGKTSTGKSKYYFSMKSEGSLMEEIPEGFEIYEHPSSAQVFLRKKKTPKITDLEAYIVEKSLKQLDNPGRFLFDIRDNAITIFQADNNMGDLKEIYGGFLDTAFFGAPDVEKEISSQAGSPDHYTPVLRFTLEDVKRRTFFAQRFCFRSSVDDWIYIDGPKHLKDLVKTYLKHLGRESFFDLF